MLMEDRYDAKYLMLGRVVVLTMRVMELVHPNIIKAPLASKLATVIINGVISGPKAGIDKILSSSNTLET